MDGKRTPLDGRQLRRYIASIVTGDCYLSYLFVHVTLIRNRSKNYKFNFLLVFNVTTSPSS